MRQAGDQEKRRELLRLVVSHACLTTNPHLKARDKYDPRKLMGEDAPGASSQAHKQDRPIDRARALARRQRALAAARKRRWSNGGRRDANDTN